jgi:hypothetical protein
MRAWTVEEANQAIPHVRAVIERIRALVREGRASAEEDSGRVQGNGQRTHGGAAAVELRAALDELASDGIELRDPETGLVDFPARSPSGKPYWLCWLPEEPEVGWWHWPETGFAGRRPLSDPPD